MEYRKNNGETEHWLHIGVVMWDFKVQQKPTTSHYQT
jgi:hypothetical protein